MRLPVTSMTFKERSFSLLLLLAMLVPFINASENVVILDQSKTVSGGLEWAREIVSKSEGVIGIKISVKDGGKFSVILLADDDYQIVMGKKPEPPDFKPKPLINVDAKDSFERNIPLDKGTYWFIIENQEEKERELRLVCSEIH